MVEANKPVKTPVEELEKETKPEAAQEKEGLRKFLGNSDTPNWVSLSQRKRENKQFAKSMGQERYVGGGFMQDKRWNKEEAVDEDGNLERVSFLKKLKLASFAPIEAMKDRIKCPLCNRMSKYYCFQCMAVVGDYSPPQIDLPVKVTLLSHPKEKKSKSSVIPIKILAPDHVDFISSVDAPDFLADGTDPKDIAVLFPSEDATEVTSMSEAELRSLKRVIIIDSTWGQCKQYVL